MSIIRKAVLLYAVAALLTPGSRMVAQTTLDGGFILPAATEGATLKAAPRADASTDEMRLGYCVDEPRIPGLMLQDDGQAHAVGAAIELPPSLLNKYVGDKIEAIDFAISPVRGQSCIVFVSTDITDMQIGGMGTTNSIISSVTLRSGNYNDGWNHVALTKPVTISQDQTLYVGYIIDGREGPYDFLLFDQSTYAVSGRNWYGDNGNWFNNTAGINRNLCIRAVVTGDNKPQNDISLMNIAPADGSGYSTQNTPKDYIAYVQNNGTEPITSLAITVEGKGLRTADFVTDGLNITNNTPFRVDLKGISLPFEGNYDGTFTVQEVNGDEDPDMTDNVRTLTGCYSIKEGTVPSTHRVLFEEFSSEGYDGCFTADTLYTNALLNIKNIIRVKHHLDYKKVEDQFSFGTDWDYEDLYGGSSLFVPAVCFDRRAINGFDDPGPAYFCPYSEMTSSVLMMVRDINAFIDLDVTPVIKDANSNQLEVNVKGKAGVNEMPLQNTLRLTTWLVEDSIPTTTQAGVENFVQNGVLRAVLSENGAWGDDLDITNYDFERNYTVALDPSWNRNHLRVVSFVSNWSDRNVRNRYLYNANEAPVSDLTAIVDASADAVQPSVLVLGSSLATTNGGRIEGVYDVSGRQVGSTHLPNGLYIVKVTNGKTTTTQKVYVK